VAEAAIKKPGRPDMALILSESDASVAAMFTRNRVKAAPVRLDMARVRSGLARAVVVNSGNANACTGVRGMKDAVEAAALAARGLGVPEGRVLVCSTGVIGVPMPMDRVRPAVAALVEKAGGSGLEEAARAIMTTDSFPKFISQEVRAGGRAGVIAGICKGAGMIAPDMATMLCFIMTDLAVEKRALKAALREAVRDSFNLITIDGDMSTNDTVIAMANGMAGNRPLAEGSRDFRAFSSALSEVCSGLARMIARDGEGATRLVEIEVSGARDEAQARRAALSLANSLLLKTAIHGGDPNVGRVMAALGAAGVGIREESTDVYMGRLRVVRRGVVDAAAALRAAAELRGEEVSISVRLGLGHGRARALTCDISEEYVRIYAEYTT